MAKDIEVLKARVDRLRNLHLQALGAYHCNWEIVRFTGKDVVGQERAQANARALGRYNNFVQPVLLALGTELHISLAKIYDDHRCALNIKKLVDYANGNKKNLISEDNSAENEDEEQELKEVYEGLSQEDTDEIAATLDAVSGKILQLKVLRNKVIAHADLSGADGVEFLSFGDLNELIQVHAKILDIISRKYYGETTFYEWYKQDAIKDTNRLLKLIGDEYDRLTSQ